MNAAEKFDYNYQFIQTVIDSLQNLPCYFPEWLVINSLLEKLQALLTTLKSDFENICITKSATILEKTEINHSIVEANQSNWLMVTLTNPKKRELVGKHINIIIEKYNLRDIILSVEVPKQSIYKNILLLNCRSIEVFYRYIQAIEYIQQIQPVKLEYAQQMLRA